MAIDTINEKLALIEYDEVYQPGIPISNDGIDQADKQQLLWGYPGILWQVIGLAVGIVTMTITSSKPGILFTESKPDISFTASKPRIDFSS